MVFVTKFMGGTHGTAKSARDFLRALLTSSDNVKVVSPVQEEFPTQHFGGARDSCSLVTRLSRPEWLTPPAGFSLKTWKLRLTTIKEWIREKRKRSDFKSKVNGDFVFVNGWASYAYWQSMESYFNGRKVFIVRESPRHFAGSDRNQSLQEMLTAFSRFDHLLFVSDRVRQEWLQHEKISKMGWSVLPNCCEEEDATEYLALDRMSLRAKYGYSPDDFVVLCPGTIEHRKGQDLLFKIVPRLQNAIPHLRILYVGNAATEWGQDFISSIARESGENIVTHLDTQPDLFDLLHMADVLAFPSRAEALPRTVLEAMVMKTPIVASSVDGIPELVENGRNGLLFDCDDSDGLFNGILTLYSSPELRTKYAESAYSRYWEHFSREHQFTRLGIILNELESSHVVRA